MTSTIPLHPDAANSLMLAMIDVSTAPLLLLDGDFNILAASEAFCLAFQTAPQSLAGRKLGEIGTGQWANRQLDSLLRRTVSGSARVDAYEMDLLRDDGAARRLVLTARKLDYFDTENVRIMLTVADVTEARIAEKLKDDLVREKVVLLQELQHRVANSLQIIASVLLQSAKRVQSEETRTHLHNASHRVMSVAAIQKQLAATRLGDVALRPYFEELCSSIGASMIHDPDQLSLKVSADDSVVGADLSTSLGLIVTELVINALKHAFPDHRSGAIRVDYQSKGEAWTLSVGDDGVGMPSDPKDATPGLGTGIVEALAKQMDATVQITSETPGTTVSIVHT